MKVQWKKNGKDCFFVFFPSSQAEFGLRKRCSLQPVCLCVHFAPWGNLKPSKQFALLSLSLSLPSNCHCNCIITCTACICSFLTAQWGLSVSGFAIRLPDSTGDSFFHFTRLSSLFAPCPMNLLKRQRAINCNSWITSKTSGYTSQCNEWPVTSKQAQVTVCPQPKKQVTCHHRANNHTPFGPKGEEEGEREKKERERTREEEKVTPG